MLHAQYCMAIPARHGHLAVRGHMVGKRIVDRQHRRVVLVWRATTEYDGVVLNGAAASQFHETGWIAISERPQTPHDVSPSSVVETVLRIHPRHSTASASQPRVSVSGIRDFADAVVGSFERSFNDAQRLTETAILQSIAVRS